jgi:hypothetical protein
VALLFCIWCVLGDWRRQRRFHRRWRRATLGGWLVPWVPNRNPTVDAGTPSYYEAWLDNPSVDGFKGINSIKVSPFLLFGPMVKFLTSTPMSHQPITASTTPTYPNSRTTLVSYPQPKPLTLSRRLRDALLVPSTGPTHPTIPSVMDKPLPPRRVNLGMVSATVQAGIVITMPDNNQQLGASRTHGDGEPKKSLARGQDICIGVLVENRKESQWVIGGRFI